MQPLKKNFNHIRKMCQTETRNGSTSKSRNLAPCVTLPHIFHNLVLKPENPRGKIWTLSQDRNMKLDISRRKGNFWKEEAHCSTNEDISSCHSALFRILWSWIQRPIKYRQWFTSLCLNKNKNKQVDDVTSVSCHIASVKFWRAWKKNKVGSKGSSSLFWSNSQWVCLTIGNILEGLYMYR